MFMFHFPCLVYIELRTLQVLTYIIYRCFLRRNFYYSIGHFAFSRLLFIGGIPSTIPKSSGSSSYYIFKCLCIEGQYLALENGDELTQSI